LFKKKKKFQLYIIRALNTCSDTEMFTKNKE
jgi:hypothetical protein